VLTLLAHVRQQPQSVFDVEGDGTIMLYLLTDEL